MPGIRNWWVLFTIQRIKQDCCEISSGAVAVSVGSFLCEPKGRGLQLGTDSYLECGLCLNVCTRKKTKEAPS